MIRTIINAEGYEIEVRYGGTDGDFISLTDIVRYKTSENPGYVIQNWMRNRNTVRFLGLWEQYRINQKWTHKIRQSHTVKSNGHQSITNH